MRLKRCRKGWASGLLFDWHTVTPARPPKVMARVKCIFTAAYGCSNPVQGSGCLLRAALGHGSGCTGRVQYMRRKWPPSPPPACADTLLLILVYGALLDAA